MSREVLAPPLQRIGKHRCYRVNLIDNYFGEQMAALQKNSSDEVAARQDTAYVEPDLYAEDDDVDDEEQGGLDDGVVIEELPNSQFQLSMNVPALFFGGLIGHKGNTRRRLETETKTEICVPRRQVTGKNLEPLIVKGKTRSSVCAALRKIQLLVKSMRKRTKPTHFTCVALNKDELPQRFAEFQQQVLLANLPSIDESLLQTQNRLHLTLTVCVLLDEVERNKAVQLLQSCNQFLSDLETPFKIHVKGLQIMNDDPSATRIVYAGVEAPDLQKFADRMHKAFVNSGFAKNEFGRDTVKLHMTILNIKYANKRNASTQSNFDSRELLKRWADYDFGTAYCSEVQLCIMPSIEGTNDFYKVTGTLKF